MTLFCLHIGFCDILVDLEAKIDTRRGCLCSVHDVTLRIAILQFNSTMEAKHAFCKQYIFPSKMQKWKSLCVSLFPHVYLKSGIDCCVWFCMFQKWLQKFPHFWQYVVFEDRYSKSLSQSLKNISVTTIDLKIMNLLLLILWWPHLSTHLYQPEVLRLRIWLPELIKNEQF